MRRKLVALLSALFLLSGTLLVANVALAANQAADLDQCANGQSPSLPTNGCNNTPGTSWVNGNLNASKSVYREGDSIAYRMRFTNIVTGSAVHTVVIEWDTTKGGKHAIDYLTTWNRTVSDANPCLGVAGCTLGSPSSTLAIPVDSQVKSGQDLITGNSDDVNPGPDGTTNTADDATANTGLFTMWGGTLTNASAITYPNGTGWTGDKSARLTLSFTASVANPVLAWGGHIATRLDWGVENSAVAISGSPYHMRLIDLDGAGGNQDRSLSADAVIFPASITIIKDANAAGTFQFTAGPAPLSNFSLSPTASTDATTTFGGIINFTNYTIVETVPASWDLTSRSCVTTSGNGGSTGLTTNGVTVNLKEGENVTCTFVNFLRNPALTIDKTVVSVGADNVAPFLVTAAGQVITYRVVVTNTGNVPLTGVSVTDPLVANLDCDSVTAGQQNTGLSIALGGSLTCTGTYTVPQSVIDNNGGGDGDIDNTATADSNETGPATDSESVPVSRTPSLSIDKTVTSVDTDTTAPFLVDAANDVISYRVVVTNTGNTTLTSVEVSDPLIANLDCDTNTAGNQTTGFTLAPGATLTCTGTYTVPQSVIDNNGGGDGDIDNTATADSAETGPATDSEAVPLSRTPGLDVDKTVSSVKNSNGTTDSDGEVDAAGDVIHYQVVVSNTGNVTLTGVSVSDPLINGNLDCDAVTAGQQTSNLTINVGGSITCTGSYTVTQADINNNGGGDGDIDNTATADSNETGPDDDSETVPVDRNPALGIDKTVVSVGTDTEAPFSVGSAGDVITYQVVVSNTGNVTLTGVSVSDPLINGNLDCDAVTAGQQTSGLTINVGGSITCTGSYTVLQGDLDDNGGGDGDIDNTATADSNETGPASDSEAVPLAPSASLNVEKTVSSVKNSDGTTDSDGKADAAGDVIHYQVVVSNTGNVTLTGVSVSDPLINGNLDCLPAAGQQTSGLTINVGGSITCTGSYTVTQADLDDNGGGDGDIDNTATADSNETGPDDDSETVPVDPNPGYNIVKVDDYADGQKFENLGDVITYTITVYNTGNTTLVDLVVTDPNAPNIDCSSDAGQQTTITIPVGGNIVCSASHTITQDDLDAGFYLNTACVDDGEGGEDEDCDSVNTPGKNQPTIDTSDYLVPQDSVTLAGLTAGVTDGDLYIELRINETCAQDGTPAWSYTWENVSNGTYSTADILGADAQDVTVSTDATIRWCTSYSGDANNAARPIDDRDEVVAVDFHPLASAAFGATIPLIAWFLWSRRRRENA